MADAITVDGIHAISGNCELCGAPCDPNAEELNVLTCTFSNCKECIYHQDCLEKYLKNQRLEKNRKTGFKCPRGCGKGTHFKDPCPGKVDKSHPIHPRNEELKKKKKAKIPEVYNQHNQQQQQQRLNATNRGNKAKGKEDAKKETEGKQEKGVGAGNKQQRDEATKAGPSKCAVAAKDLERQRKLVEAVKKEGGRQDLQRAGREKMVGPTVTFRLQPPAKPPAVNAWATRTLVIDKHPNKGPQPQPSIKLPPNKPAVSPPQPPPPPLPPGQVPLQRVPAALRHIPQEPPAQLAGQAPDPACPPEGEHEAPVGMEYVSEKQEAKLTKAQKKNLKRAEKKKKCAAMENMSLASSEQEVVAQAEEDNVMYDLCIQAIVARKTLHHVEQLQKLGFAEWLSAIAVQKYGSDLDGALGWLLESDIQGIAEAVRSGRLPPAASEVDIGQELQQLQNLQSSLMLAAKTLHQVVADACGDLDMAAAMLTERSEHGHGGELTEASSDITEEVVPERANFVAGPHIQEVNGGEQAGYWPQPQAEAPSGYTYQDSWAGQQVSAASFNAWVTGGPSRTQEVHPGNLATTSYSEVPQQNTWNTYTSFTDTPLHQSLQTTLSELTFVGQAATPSDSPTCARAPSQPQQVPQNGYYAPVRQYAVADALGDFSFGSRQPVAGHCPSHLGVQDDGAALREHLSLLCGPTTMSGGGVDWGQAWGTPIEATTRAQPCGAATASTQPGGISDKLDHQFVRMLQTRPRQEAGDVKESRLLSGAYGWFQSLPRVSSTSQDVLAPQAALFGSEAEGSTSPDDKELDALVATLTCH